MTKEDYLRVLSYRTALLAEAIEAQLMDNTINGRADDILLALGELEEVVGLLTENTNVQIYAM